MSPDPGETASDKIGEIHLDSELDSCERVITHELADFVALRKDAELLWAPNTKLLAIGWEFFIGINRDRR